MSGPRVVDDGGAAWPVTGHRCLVCRMPLDPAAGPTHPGCAPGPALSPDDEARVLALLARVLGAVEIRTDTKEIAP